jgi:hypothetical protein
VLGPSVARHLRDGCGRTRRRQPAARRVPSLQERDTVLGLKQINGGVPACDPLQRLPRSADSSRLDDGSRIYPGDGVAPLRQILRDLRDNGFAGYLSLELFNRDYWARSADENLKTAMEKIRDTVRSAMT